MPLSNGAELSVAAAVPGKTYELGPGTYTINQTIDLSTATTTCFPGASRAGVTVLVATNDDTESGRAFLVSDGAKLGLFSLVLDGQDTAPGVRVDGAALQVDDVTLQRLRLRLESESPGGAAVGAFSSAQVPINGSDLLDNTCDNCCGGALELFVSEAELQEVCEPARRHLSWHGMAVHGNMLCTRMQGTHDLAGFCWLDAGQAVAQHGRAWWHN